MLTMDFFESQSRAHRRTFLLVLMFAVAVVLIIMVTYLALVFAVALTVGMSSRDGSMLGLLFRPDLFMFAAGSTLLIIGGGTFFKIWDLRGGGDRVAQQLGGVPVSADTTDPDERKLMNVVEEMSIASGCPVPSVFVLPGEYSINGFAAGYSPSDAAVCVTRGAIGHLTRDELQGVIAHEFSHIINGDMRLNIRLIGVLNGIVLISVFGRVVMHMGMGGGGRSYGYSRNERNRGAPQLILAGLIIFLAGLIGVVFARLIKAAVSRQREYLADAAAVQFTRNPGGLAGALKKIGGLGSGSRINDPHAEETSHLFFANGLESSGLAMVLSGGLLATHPPLPKRIKAIDPTFDGTYPKVEELARDKPRLTLAERPEPPKVQPPAAPLPGVLGGGPVLPPGQGQPGVQQPDMPRVAITAAAILAGVGQVRPENVEKARRTMEKLPEELRVRMRRPGSAQSVIIALLIAGDSRALDEAWKGCEPVVPEELRFETGQLLEQVNALEDETHLALVDLALPALKGLSAEEAKQFLDTVRAVIRADNHTSMFEFAIEKVLAKQLDAEVRVRSRRGAQYYALQGVRGPLVIVLSALAWAGTENAGDAAQAFQTGLAGLNLKGMPMNTPLAAEECGLEAVEKAFDELILAAPGVKRQVLEACTQVVVWNGVISAHEGQLLRAVAEALDIPLPPVM